MLSKVFSSALIGIDAYLVEIEVDVAKGLPSVTIVGLADMAIKESKERVKSAILNSDFNFPIQRLTVNLAPADTKKQGAAFDLAIALGILSASQQIENLHLNSFIILGELALDGALRPIPGVLPMVIYLHQKYPDKKIMIPNKNLNEIQMIDGIQAYGVEHLKDAIQILSNPGQAKRMDKKSIQTKNFSKYDIDFMDVVGQKPVKRALEVAASGGHNVLMIGPPGSGKSMIAKRIPTILPPLTQQESLETTKILSVVGQIPTENSIMFERPFRSPHHTISDVALIGGGAYPKPGEVSMAHNGVLFLDELPEFKRNVLEVLRQPLEDYQVSISRAQGAITFPSRFMLVAAMNPCPCGYLTDLKKECRCSPLQIERYRSKISGPLLDRIDIHIEVPAVELEHLDAKGYEETSSQVRDRVMESRKIQWVRFKDKKYQSNALMSVKDLDQFCVLNKDIKLLLKKATQELGLSLRAIHKVMKVARTIADMDQSEKIEIFHIAEAIQYRFLDRKV